MAVTSMAREAVGMPHVVRSIVENLDMRETDETDDQHAQHGGDGGTHDGIGALYRVRLRACLR
jgi:hypothetical protein